MKRVLGVLALCAMAVGCGSGGSVSGTIDGQTLSVKDTIFGELTGGDGSGGTQTVLVLFLSDTANLCADFKNGTQPGGSSIIGAGMYSIDGNTGGFGTPGTGTYTAAAANSLPTSGNVATMAYNKYDSGCTSTIEDTVSSGTIKVTTLDAKSGGTLAGSFDVTFATKSDHVTGAMNATWCDLPADLLTANSLTCN